MPHRPAHRPSKLTPEVTEQIAQLIEAGNVAEVAAAASGIARTTYFRWMREGEDERAAEIVTLPEGQSEDDLPAAEEGTVRAFFERILQAKARSQARNVAIVTVAASHDWRAAAWMLERQDPQSWQQRSTTTLRGDPEAPLAMRFSSPKEELRQRLEAIKERQAHAAAVVPPSRPELMPPDEGNGSAPSS